MKKNLVVDFHWIYYVMKIYIICCIYSQANAKFWKNLAPEIWPKMLKANQIAGFLSQQFLQNRSIKQSHFLYVDTNSQKLKFENFLAESKMGLANLVSELLYCLYLKNEQMESTGFFSWWYKSTQIKRWLKILGVSSVKNGFGQSGDGTLKLTVLVEWTDEINWFFACWYRFKKVKWGSNIFWLGIVKHGCGQPGHRTLKLTASQKWTGWINWFFHAGTNLGKLKVDSVIFGWVWSKISMAF